MRSIYPDITLIETVSLEYRTAVDSISYPAKVTILATVDLEDVHIITRDQ